MYCVYLLRSISNQNETYIGYTENLKKRIVAHNNGQSIHTARFKPWQLTAYFAFDTQEKALAFERYLKSGSGRAFAKKHFWL